MHVYYIFYLSVPHPQGFAFPGLLVSLQFFSPTGFSLCQIEHSLYQIDSSSNLLNKKKLLYYSGSNMSFRVHWLNNSGTSLMIQFLLLLYHLSWLFSLADTLNDPKMAPKHKQMNRSLCPSAPGEREGSLLIHGIQVPTSSLMVSYIMERNNHTTNAMNSLP